MRIHAGRCATLGACLLAVSAFGQGLQQQQLPPQPAESQAARPTAGVPSTTQQRNASGQISIPSQFQGSVATGTRTNEEIPISVSEAITRALRTNLGVVSGNENVRISRAERLRALNALVPTLTTRTTETIQQVNLAAFGFPGFPGIPSVVGPFQVVDTRAYVSQNVLNFNALLNRRASGASLRAAEFNYRDTRDQVVLAVVYLYLQAISGETRVETSRAELATAEALLKLTQDQKSAGVVAGIDVLRAQVEQQSQRQRLIFYQAEAEKQKLNLARAIGLPLGQRFRLVDRIPYTPYSVDAPESVIEQAFRSRSDFQAAESQVRAAELNKSAARAERLPSVTLDANYGAIGRKINEAHGTFTVAGGLQIPIFQGTRVRAEIEEADAQLQQRRAERESLRGQIDNEVRTALLDLRATAEQVEVARSSLDLAGQQLVQARDRFSAGVTNNIEVIQAQESVTTANENYITSLYQFNLAKASLIRAIGGSEQAIKQVLQGVQP